MFTWFDTYNCKNKDRDYSGAIFTDQHVLFQTKTILFETKVIARIKELLEIAKSHANSFEKTIEHALQKI